MTESALEVRLRELAEQTTPGPWASGGDSVYAVNPYRTIFDVGAAEEQDSQNFEFIAAADPQTVLRLLGVVAAVRTLRESGGNNGLPLEGSARISPPEDSPGEGGGFYVGRAPTEQALAELDASLAALVVKGNA